MSALVARKNGKHESFVTIGIDRMDGSPCTVSGGFVSRIETEYDIGYWNDNNTYHTDVGPGVTVKLYFPEGLKTLMQATTADGL